MDGKRLRSVDKQEVLRLGSFLGLGFYVTGSDGRLLECDKNTKELLQISENETDLSKYSIKDIFVVPHEWERRIAKIKENLCTPLTSTINARINGKNKLIFDMCWCCPEKFERHPCFIGLLTEIEANTISPKMHETFPRGLFELDNDGKIVRVNRKLINILNYPDESLLLGTKFNSLCIEQDSLNRLNDKIRATGSGREILTVKDYFCQPKEVECFAQEINEFGLTRWGMITDVTKREQYYRALDSAPTGFYYIEKEKIKQCNEYYAKLMGFDSVGEAIGKDARNYFVSNPKEYLKDLREVDKKNQALQNYPVKIKRANDGTTVTLAVDAVLVKNANGQVIGRRGTIRDISERVKLENKIGEAEKNIKKTTTDINNLIHTFLHPVVAFSGNAELIHLMGKTLQKTLISDMISIAKIEENSSKLGNKLIKRLIKIRDDIPELDEIIPFSSQKAETDKFIQHKAFTMRDLKRKMSLMINLLDFSLNSKESNVTLDGAIRDTALWLLEELTQIDYEHHEVLKYNLSTEFVNFLQNILFSYMNKGTKLLMDETKIMKREVEAFRRFLGFQQKKKFAYVDSDVGMIAENALELFRPVFAEAGLEIYFKKSGNLIAPVSQNDLDRVFCNLYQNARKYSKIGRARFVKIRLRELGNTNQVEFSIVNLGLPIKKEEIDSGAIWQSGYRSELAKKSDRDGTGTGLADAQEVISAHHGEIFISSTPTKGESDPPEYKVPYKTKITIRLPKTRVSSKQEKT